MTKLTWETVEYIDYSNPYTTAMKRCEVCGKKSLYSYCLDDEDCLKVKLEKDIHSFTTEILNEEELRKRVVYYFKLHKSRLYLLKDIISNRFPKFEKLYNTFLLLKD